MIPTFHKDMPVLGALNGATFSRLECLGAQSFVPCIDERDVGVDDPLLVLRAGIFATGLIPPMGVAAESISDTLQGEEGTCSGEREEFERTEVVMLP